MKYIIKRTRRIKISLKVTDKYDGDVGERSLKRTLP